MDDKRECRDHWTITRDLQQEVKLINNNLTWLQKDLIEKIERIEKRATEKKNNIIYPVIVGLILLGGQLLFKYIR